MEGGGVSIKCPDRKTWQKIENKPRGIKGWPTKTSQGQKDVYQGVYQHIISRYRCISRYQYVYQDINIYIKISSYIYIVFFNPDRKKLASG